MLLNQLLLLKVAVGAELEGAALGRGAVNHRGRWQLEAAARGVTIF